MQHSLYNTFALELTMQDVMDNMTELSTELSYDFNSGGFENLSIEPEHEDNVIAMPLQDTAH